MRRQWWWSWLGFFGGVGLGVGRYRRKNGGRQRSRSRGRSGVAGEKGGWLEETERRKESSQGVKMVAEGTPEIVRDFEIRESE